ncbi:uncharacterized protein EV420DRAFT_141017 [Desarmillaria tabescens]|uniref:Uncharacterized protein n=1 Tax=Armillaria tabescens TaxID=1929756 RepID=A0AA39TPL4_ARMTA|nr:uncharacterized protein EV420DRAFT_141017 [Desarmillaria tabescens]KAK0462013.1 hypothetical protein EV420DRAFT_141017 [Desarmillaria tabescens]
MLTASDDEGDEDDDSFYSLSDGDEDAVSDTEDDFTPQVCRSPSPLGTEASRTSTTGSFETCETRSNVSIYETAEDTDVEEELPSIPRSRLSGGRAPPVARQWSEETLVNDFDDVPPTDKDWHPPSPISRPGPPRRGIRPSFGLSLDDAELVPPRPVSPHLSSPPPTPPPTNRRAEKSRATDAEPSSSGPRYSTRRASRPNVGTNSSVPSRPPTPASPRPISQRITPHPEKPREPVASDYPMCSNPTSDRHAWKINANAFQRTYRCDNCPIKVKEKALKVLSNDGRRWEAAGVTL